MINSYLRCLRGARFGRVAIAAASAVAAVALIGSSGCATAPADVSQAGLAFPSPIAGPGQPDLEKAARRHIEDGWQDLLRGDSTAARAAAARAGESAASQLLEFQSEVVAGAHPVSGLEDLTQNAPQYAAAWLTLSVASEGAGNESLALRAAERGAALWPIQRWIDRSRSLRTRWIGDRIAEARTLFDGDQPRAALDTLAPALELDPTNYDGILLKAQSLVALDDLDRAEAVLAPLPRDREVVFLSADIAERRGDTAAAIRIYSSLADDPEAILAAIALAEQESDWQTAMDLYSSLPDGHPEKAAGLRAAKLRWRISVLPPYVRESLSTKEMNRSDLAVLLVTLAPEVETLPSKQVPLMSDIVDMPSQREIIIATRLGLIDVDRLEHRFDPLRQVTEGEVRSAITRLGHLIDSPPPGWCGETTAEQCVSFGNPVAGEKVASVIITMVAGGTT